MAADLLRPGNFIFQAPPADIFLDRPIAWESAVSYVNFQDRKLRSVRFQPILHNKIGQGQPDVQDEPKARSRS